MAGPYQPPAQIPTSGITVTNFNGNLRRHEAARYRICLSGFLDASWSEMLAGMSVINWQIEDDRFLTLLRGELVDQAALFGVLNLVYDLGMSVLLVECEGASLPPVLPPVLTSAG